MEIQKYLEQIRSLEKEHFNQNVDLENMVSEIISNEKTIQFRVNDLFQNQNLNTELLFKIEQTLNLIFIQEENSNVCFANDSEVRPEFKQSFSLQDLLDYIYAFAHSFSFKESGEIVISGESDLFWKLIKTADK